MVARINRSRFISAANGGLSFDAPGGGTQGPAVAKHEYDEYVSDPANPVPYRTRPVTEDGDGWRQWLVMDQRFVDGRTDVLTYVSCAADEAVARERSAGSESVRVDERHG